MLKIKHIPQYTYNDYENWEGDWELIDGYPFAMSPSATGKHQLVAGEMLFQIKQDLNKSNCTNNCFIYSELDWIIDIRNVVRPDLAVVCEKKVEKFIEEPPALIVEIISETSAYRDRIIKKELYEFNNVKYYFIADPESKTVETFELINGKYETTAKKKFVLNENCKTSLVFEGIW